MLITELLPQSIIAYMDPVSQSPTRNDVVHEALERSLKVANETDQKYLPVTYVLTIAIKTYCIQNLMASKFDKLLIKVGNFYLELAFFGAVDSYLADCGVEYILTECHILAEGSLNGFSRGKFCNRVNLNSPTCRKCHGE